MPGNKLTDKEIIQALECCLDTSPLTCKDCSMFNATNSTMVCSKIVTKFALDLINRYEAENKVLYKINAKSDEEISELRKELLKKQNLKEGFSKIIKEFDKKLAKTVKLERAEAIKEFAERLKRASRWREEDIYYIDTLVEIMVGDDK